MSLSVFSRRSLFAGLAAAPVLLNAAGKKVPIGLELYSVRDMMAKDEIGTVKQVAALGYQCVEFYGPYFNWTPAQAKEIRKVLDDTGLKCHSTHNAASNLKPENLPKAIELNKIIGSKMVVMASSGLPKNEQTLDGFKKVAEALSAADAILKKSGMRAGYHNHGLEFTVMGDARPMDVIAKNTPKSVVLQLDVGTCVEMKQDPVAWIKQNPGRIRSIHCKEWSPDKGYKVLFGDGAAPWKAIFAAAESVGGIEFYLIEQEGYSTPSIEASKVCLENYKKLRGI
ncbi:MAG: sugar phosphate isomerase/epimerase [Bryobacterales bacterium]|nr:sugar phosphate isomerase/epimerase [Bryobacterales bacterium]